MFKRKLLIDLCIALTFFMTIWFVGQHDRNTYQIQLDHGGLSQEAIIFDSKSSMTMQQLVQKLSVKNWTSYQVQFIDPKAPNVSYIYAKQLKNNFSMINGRNFTTSDFDAPLPFAIVGQDYADQLYKPQEQAYLHYQGAYIPVIGQVGASGTSPLNRHRFITVTPKQATQTLRLKQVRVIADGTLVNQHKQAFRRLVKAKHAKTYVPQTQNETFYRRWGSKTIMWLIYGGAFVILTLLTWLFYMTLRRALKTSPLDTTLNLKMKWGFLRQYMVHFLISALAGYLIGIWQTYLISAHITSYYLIGVTVYNIILMLSLVLTTKIKSNTRNLGGR